MENVVFRFRRPSDSSQHQPSAAMAGALKLLSESPEMQPLLVAAGRVGRSVAIEVFQSRDGEPILIHFTKETAA